MNRTIAIGDVHGCLNELQQLVTKCQLKPSDRLVFVGDLLDRGPNPAGAVRFVRKLGAQADMVLANHEEKALRWFKHEAKRTVTGKKNPMTAPHPERLEQWNSLTEEDREWLRTRPVTLDLGEWLVVHGGFEQKPLEEQRPDRMIRCRFLDEETGEMMPLGDDPWTIPEGAVYWSERWTGKNVVYGHAVHSLTKPRVDRNGSTECWGIDTGCVFGGRLTALVLETREVIQVGARKRYATPYVELAP